MNLRAKRISTEDGSIPKGSQMSAKILVQITKADAVNLNAGCCITAATGCHLCTKFKDGVGLPVSAPVDVKLMPTVL